jgi:hypothetical protein
LIRDFQAHSKAQVDGRSRKRKRKQPPMYRASTWGRMLDNDAAEMLNDPDGRLHKQFRLRFRVPYPLFLVLVKWTCTWYNVSTKDEDAAGVARVPVELLVLGVLRMLGRGTCLDGILELSCISTTKMNHFFHDWCAHVAADLFKKEVTFPTTDAEIKKVLDEFDYVGFPGCIGSMDVVHIHWDMCPASLKVLCTGKEKYPSLAYQVIVDHTGKATSCTAGAYGSVNDKTIVKFDGRIAKLRQGSHGHVRYKLRTKKGEVITRKGVYVMVDSGYLEWEVTMAACATNPSPGYVAWRTKLMSVRKDVECFFGRLKSRFRILKLPIQLHKKTQIDNVFFTCVTLQNMLHKWDALGKWSLQSDNLEGEIEGDDASYWSLGDDTDHMSVATGSFHRWRSGTYFVDNTDDISGTAQLRALLQDEQQKYEQLESALVDHFQYLISTNQHKNWLRSRKE